MIWQSWRHERRRRTNPHSFWATLTQQRLVVGGLALALFMLTVACEPGPFLSSASTSSTSTPNPLSRIHNVTPGAEQSEPLFASVIFTPSTTYEQAVALLGREPLLWSCDGVPSHVPSGFAAGRAAFATSHTLYISYPYWDLLKRIASSPQVTGIYGFAPYPCP